MFRKLFLVFVLLLLVLGAGLFFWARAAFSGDSVRTAVAAQISKAIGQPVSIGGLSATILPRVTMDLTDVTVGQPVRITIKHLRVGTDFRALLSRRIEHASVNLTGARVEFPLPAFTMGAMASSSTPDAAALRPLVEIVSVDEVVCTGVDVVRGGRTLHGDVNLVPAGKGFTIRSLALRADQTALDLSGQITDVAGPTGDLAMKASGLNILDLVAFASDFTGAGAPAANTAPATPSATSTPMNVLLAIEADRAIVGALPLDKLTARARITSDAITLEPIQFGVFGGGYNGSLSMTLTVSPDFHMKASLSGLDMAAVTTFAGRPGTITGRLSGTIDVLGRVTTPDRLLATTRGSARIDIVNGSIKDLGLVRNVVLATSMRKSSEALARSKNARETFSRLGLNLTIAAGAAKTANLKFESPDVLLSAMGAIRLDGSAIELAGPLQLSDALSRQAGRDLARYTQKDGRVTVPVVVNGSLENLHVGVDAGEIAKRAITNRVKEELAKALIRIIKR